MFLYSVKYLFRYYLQQYKNITIILFIEKYKMVVKKYLKYQEMYEKQYGSDKVIVFMQVGSFFEAYATKERGYELGDIATILNFELSRFL